jgi:hypothetical protein
MKKFSAILLCVFFAGISLALQTCTLLTLPLATVFGGAQLAIKGGELQKEIRKADVQEAFDSPFEKTWNMSVIALVNLHIEVTRVGRTPEGKGGLIEGRAQKIKIKVIAVEVTPDITEVGIWAEHDKALAGLIAEKIREEAQKEKMDHLPFS